MLTPVVVGVSPEELAWSQSIMRQWSITGEEMDTSIGELDLVPVPDATEADTAACVFAVREFNFSLVEGGVHLAWILTWEFHNVCCSLSNVRQYQVT